MPEVSLDFTQVWNQAISFLNNLWPVFAIPLGIILGIGLLNFVVKAVKSAVSSF